MFLAEMKWKTLFQCHAQTNNQIALSYGFSLQPKYKQITKKLIVGHVPLADQDALLIGVKLKSLRT